VADVVRYESKFDYELLFFPVWAVYRLYLAFQLCGGSKAADEESIGPTQLITHSSV